MIYSRCLIVGEHVNSGWLTLLELLHHLIGNTIDLQAKAGLAWRHQVYKKINKRELNHHVLKADVRNVSFSSNKLLRNYPLKHVNKEPST